MRLSRSQAQTRPPIRARTNIPFARSSAASSSPTTWVAKLLKRKAQKYGNVRPFRLHRNDFFHFLCPLRAILRYTFVVTSDTFCPKAWPDLTSPLFFGIAKKRRFTPGKKLLLSKTING